MIIAIDIGGTSIKYGYYVSNNLKEVKEIPSMASQGAKALFTQLCSIIETTSQLEGIAISTAGQVDVKQGKITYAGNSIPDYTGFNLKEQLSNIFKVPVAVENDVNCAALSEIDEGCIKDYDMYLCLTIGTGIGGSVIFEKRVLHGTSFSLGEFGYLPIKNKTFEEIASTSALVERVKEYDNKISSGHQIINNINNNDIKNIVLNWIDDLVMGLNILTIAFNPKYIIIGGGILDARDTIFDLINDKYLEICKSKSFIKTKLKATTFYNHAGLRGAYINFQQQLKQ